MTTTGVAMNQDIVQALRPRIIVVEEAAEILEAQLLACLTDSVEHLILIGDHKQLRYAVFTTDNYLVSHSLNRPSVECHELVLRNKIDISLFERMINNGVPHVTLSQQRRMHPSIS